MDVNSLPERGDFSRIKARFWSKTRKGAEQECWNWIDAPHTTGYGVLSAQVSRTSKLIYAHRLAYFLANGAIDPGLLVCHTCDNRLCVNPAHLFLGTDGDNMRDKTAKGRNWVGRGEQVGRSKLTAAEIIAIRADARRTREIAKHYGIDHGYVAKLKRGGGWQHLSGPAPVRFTRDRRRVS